MADIKSPEERSLNMAKIRSKDTKPEVWLRKQIFERGYRYRKNVNNVPGHPDLWLAKYDTAVFVHGCFWHRHEGCRYAYMPNSHIEFWRKKFQKNIERDQIVYEELQKIGVKELIVWECTIKRMEKDKIIKEKKLMEIEFFLHSDEMRKEL